MNHIDCRVKTVLDVGLRGASGRIFADYEGDRAMRIDVVGAVLGVVFEHEDGGIVPVRTVEDGIDNAAQGEVVVGDVGRRPGPVGASTASVVVGQIEQDEAGHFELGAFIGLAGANVGGKFVEEFVGAKLVGIVGVEVGIERIVMIA